MTSSSGKWKWKWCHAGYGCLLDVNWLAVWHRRLLTKLFENSFKELAKSESTYKEWFPTFTWNWSQLSCFNWVASIPSLKYQSLQILLTSAQILSYPKTAVFWLILISERPKLLTTFQIFSSAKAISLGIFDQLYCWYHN